MQESFPDRWARKERDLGCEAIASRMVACGAAVLPDSAAPCLAFDYASHPTPVWEIFGPPADWSQIDRERLSAYLVIGSDGAGNPICLEQATGQVLLLDHEDRFHSIQFINSSVTSLAECLLAYLGEPSSARFVAAVLEIDPAALSPGAFWAGEAAAVGAA